jgi:hypothetical protein
VVGSSLGLGLGDASADSSVARVRRVGLGLYPGWIFFLVVFFLEAIVFDGGFLYLLLAADCGRIGFPGRFPWQRVSFPNGAYSKGMVRQHYPSG